MKWIDVYKQLIMCVALTLVSVIMAVVIFYITVFHLAALAKLSKPADQCDQVTVLCASEN